MTRGDEQWGTGGALATFDTPKIRSQRESFVRHWIHSGPWIPVLAAQLTAGRRF